MIEMEQNVYNAFMILLRLLICNRRSCLNYLILVKVNYWQCEDFFFDIILIDYLIRFPKYVEWTKLKTFSEPKFLYEELSLSCVFELYHTMRGVPSNPSRINDAEI